MSSPLYSGLLVSPIQYTFKREKAVWKPKLHSERASERERERERERVTNIAELGCPLHCTLASWFHQFNTPSREKKPSGPGVVKSLRQNAAF